MVYFFRWAPTAAEEDDEGAMCSGVLDKVVFVETDALLDTTFIFLAGERLLLSSTSSKFIRSTSLFLPLSGWVAAPGEGEGGGGKGLIALLSLVLSNGLDARSFLILTISFVLGGRLLVNRRDEVLLGLDPMQSGANSPLLLLSTMAVISLSEVKLSSPSKSTDWLETGTRGSVCPCPSDALALAGRHLC